jgi:nucleotide-binding universal stress UspA family protein
MKAPRILWPTDFAESDHDALVAAGDLARNWHAEVLALHVIGDVAEEVYGEKTKEGKDRAAWALWKISKEKAEKRLEELVSPTLRGVASYRCFTAFGDPATRILEAVRAEGIGLVVMAARRDKSLLQEMLLGSVAYKIVRTAPCNVMLIK